VFHDDFLSIFPEYWDSVPVNYEYIAVGMIPRHFNTSERSVYGESPILRKDLSAWLICWEALPLACSRFTFALVLRQAVDHPHRLKGCSPSILYH
jgi:hypothetical protein